MMKHSIMIPVSVLFIFTFISCGGSTDSSTNTDINNDSPDISEKKYLAKNVVFSFEDRNNTTASSKRKNLFGFSLIKSAHAQTGDKTDDVDMETKIMAENVIFENNTKSQIESDNVQGALEEISLKLSEVIIGTWSIQNYNQESVHEPNGKIEIYDDGTFDLIEGSFAAIGMGSSTDSNPLAFACGHVEDSQIYTDYTDDLIVFTHYNNTTENSVIPRLIKLRENQIVFVGSGGCGQTSRQRISVLSRL